MSEISFCTGVFSGRFNSFNFTYFHLRSKIKEIMCILILNDTMKGIVKYNRQTKRPGRLLFSTKIKYVSGADPGFDQGGGAQIVTGLKLPFWGLSFVEFWCWGLIFGGQGGPGPPGPPWIRP